MMAGAAISLSLAASSTAVEFLQSDSFPSERCAGEFKEESTVNEKKSEVTDEEIVREAWEVVNESFLDYGNRGWSPEKWEASKKNLVE